MKIAEVLGVIIVGPLIVSMAAAIFLVPVMIIFAPMLICYMIHDCMHLASPNWIVIGIASYVQLGIFMLLPSIAESGRGGRC